MHVENTTHTSTFKFVQGRSYFGLLPVKIAGGGIEEAVDGVVRDVDLDARDASPPPPPPPAAGPMAQLLAAATARRVATPPPPPQVGAVVAEDQVQVPVVEEGVGEAGQVKPAEDMEVQQQVEPEKSKPVAVVAPVQPDEEEKKPPLPKIPKRMLEEAAETEVVMLPDTDDEDEGNGDSEDPNTSGVSALEQNSQEMVEDDDDEGEDNDEEIRAKDLNVGA